MPELAFQYDESIAREERIESLLQEIRETPSSAEPTGADQSFAAPKSPVSDEGGADREE